MASSVLSKKLTSKDLATPSLSSLTSAKTSTWIDTNVDIPTWANMVIITFIPNANVSFSTVVQANWLRNNIKAANPLAIFKPNTDNTSAVYVCTGSDGVSIQIYNAYENATCIIGFV